MSAFRVPFGMSLLARWCAGRPEHRLAEQSVGALVQFPMKLLTAALAISGLALIGLVGSISEVGHIMDTAHQRDLRVGQLRGTIVHLDEVLTMSARMAATTGDLSWERRYRKFEPQLDAAVKEALQLTSHAAGFEAAAQTDAANLKLVDMENQSFALVRSGNAGEARAVLFNPAYEQQKALYADGMSKFIEQLTQELLASRRQKQMEATVFLVAASLAVILLFCTWVVVVRKLNLWRSSQLSTVRQLMRAEEALRLAHESLERHVEQRTEDLKRANTDLCEAIIVRDKAQAQLEVAHKQVVDVSREAGKAEVATSVLHNVGNVLNSINVSVDLVGEQIRRSKVSGLARVVTLLREREHDLVAFMTSDDRGRHLVPYLESLSEHLRAEQATAAGEIESLRANVAHVKQIVVMQQDHAKVSGVIELINSVDLVENSVRINADDLKAHAVQVIRQFEDNPLVNVDKHKALQILVNLVSNAKHACAASGCVDKRIVLRVMSEHGSVKISVADNGIGIAPENLTRIFSHGFTTRKDGHGFGLHSGALAARELGGRLSVYSDGIGHGAAFVLELPLPTATAALVR